MDIKGILKELAAYAAAVIIFLALGYIYCYPQLKGKVLYAGDQQNYMSASHQSWVYHEQTGDFTFWNDSMYSGMPNYQIGGGIYDADWLLRPINNFIHRPDSPGWLLFLYFLCFFICLRCFDINKWLSIVGAVAIGLSTYFPIAICAGHLTKAMTIAATAVVLGAFNLIFSKKKYVLGAVLTMVFVAGGSTKHPQMFYYYFMLIGLLWIVQLISHLKEKRWKDMLVGTVVFALSVGLGLGANSANVFANAEFTRETIRGGQSDLYEKASSDDVSNGLSLQYVTQYSYGIGESLTFLIPGAKGGATSMDIGKESGLYKSIIAKGIPASTALFTVENAPMYWGEQPYTAGGVYMGAIVCFLFLLGCLIVPGPHKWGLLIGTILSIMLAWGQHFMWLTKLFYNYFPMYSKFRAVASILIVAEVAMPLLGFLAVREMMLGRVEKKKLWKSILWSAGITGGLCLLLALFGGSLFSFVSERDAVVTVPTIPDWVYSAVIDQRKAMFRSDALRSAAFIAAAALVLWVYSKDKLKPGLLVAILGVLILLDMWPVDRRYFNYDNFVTPKQNVASFEMLPYEEQLMKDKDPNFRVYNITDFPFNDARTSYYFKSIGGYSAAKLRRYQDLIDQHLTKMHQPVIDMLNTKYIIVKGEDGEAMPMYNSGAMGNAWFVSNIMVVDNPNRESDALMTVDLRKVAVIDRQFARKVSSTTLSVPDDAVIKLTDYTPKSLTYRVSSSKPGTVVFSEIYYPYGWKATIDGKSADYFRADYILRAMNVPAGSHTINFTFEPDSVRKGNNLSRICIYLIYIATALAALYGVWILFRKKKKSE